jgi:ketosteroid isomerase-like protein
VSADTPQDWLSEFVEAVRTGDTDAGRVLFADDVVGYGTLTPRMLGLDDLVEWQWRPTWERVETWQLTDVDVVEQTDALAVLAVCWKRVNNDDHAVVHGRATLVLRRGAGSAWRCIHSHFSADPTGR